MLLIQISTARDRQIFHNICLTESSYSNRLSSPHKTTRQGRSRSRFISIVCIYFVDWANDRLAVKARLYHNKNILTHIHSDTPDCGARANPPRPYRSHSRFRANSHKSRARTAYRKSRNRPGLRNDRVSSAMPSRVFPSFLVHEPNARSSISSSVASRLCALVVYSAPREEWNARISLNSARVPGDRRSIVWRIFFVKAEKFELLFVIYF